MSLANQNDKSLWKDLSFRTSAAPSQRRIANCEMPYNAKRSARNWFFSGARDLRKFSAMAIGRTWWGNRLASRACGRRRSYRFSYVRCST